MTANVHGKMVYSFMKPMWHNITEPSLVPMTASGILADRFGGGFGIVLRPANVMLNGEMVEHDFAIVRTASPYDQTEKVFGFCTSRYLPLQPVDICASFDANVGEFAETMAFLGDGEQMFISWKMPSFELKAVGEELEMFGIVKCGFDTLNGANLFTSVVRPVCQNTISLAQGWANAHTDKNTMKGNIFKGKAVNHNLLRDLGYWMAHVQENSLKEATLLKSFFGKLVDQPIRNDAEAQGILVQAYPNMVDTSGLFPKELRSAKELKTADLNASQQELRDGIFGLFSGGGTAITPDKYGMLNATTEFFCHVFPSKRPIAESVMFGGRQAQIMKMVNALDKK